LISKGAEYSLRVVVLLSRNKGRRLAASEISEQTKISLAYIPKVLKPLISAGLVTSNRGVNGGYALKRSSKLITILDILNIVGNTQDEHVERGALSDNFASLCKKLEQLDAQIFDFCAKTTVAQLALS
jgi:Rrf2 family transcriptional regulator, nitric oxide-sensitive transcriptional repressor